MKLLFATGRAVFIAIAIAVAAPRIASADEAPSKPTNDAPGDGPNKPRARASFEEGARAYSAARYADAARAYERAAEDGVHAAPMLNAADAWELDGNDVRAATACDRGLALSPSPALRRELERRLARLTRVVGTIELRGSPELSVRIDGGETLHLPATVRVSPGRHRVEIGDRPTAAQLVEVGRGEMRSLVIREEEITLAPNAPVASGAAPDPKPAAAREPSAQGGGPPTASWIAFGAAGAGLVVTSVFSVLTLDAQGDFERDPTPERRDTFYEHRTVANVAGAVTAGAIVVGAVLWLLAPKHAAAQGSRAFGPGGARF